MAVIDIKVPDIGDFDEVGVIEVLVNPATPSAPSKAWSPSSPTRPPWRFRPATPAWSKSSRSSWATRSPRAACC
jgi:hypothetical protein